MARKITREQAIRKAINETLGTDNSSGMYSMRNIKAMLEVDFLPALEALGYTITTVDAAWNAAEADLAATVMEQCECLRRHEHNVTDCYCTKRHEHVWTDGQMPSVYAR